MADDTLSNDDIDALLGLGDESAGDDPGLSGAGAGDSGGMDEFNLDALLGGGSSSGAGSSFGGSDDGSVGLDRDAMKALSGMGSGGRAGGMQITSEGKDNVELLMDVNLRFTVELGRTTMFIKDVMLLGEGSVVELDKNVGDEVDVLINDRLFGRGRLIIMDEFFGVQITHILDTMERYRSLQ